MKRRWLPSLRIVQICERGGAGNMRV
jgi:hypothetical protein